MSLIRGNAILGSAEPPFFLFWGLVAYLSATLWLIRPNGLQSGPPAIPRLTGRRGQRTARRLKSRTKSKRLRCTEIPKVQDCSLAACAAS